MSEPLDARVGAALSRILNPRLENDLLSAGMIRDLAVTGEGRVSFTFVLSREDPATLVREARSAIRALEGVSEVKINVVDPSGPARATHGPPTGAPGQPASAAAHAPPAPAPMEQPNLGKVLAISSGKGGVGKSTVSANLAVALAQAGHRVAILDADVYGPNIPRMFGVFEKPPVVGGKIQPLEAYGVRLMSLGFLIERDAPAIWRGPIIMKIVQQFLRDVEWGQLDYCIVDLPPGTGDAQLSLVQSTHVAAALIVTTPQEVAVGDALRGAKMFERVGVPVLGVVENMTAFACPHCGELTEIFGRGGGERFAAKHGLEYLGGVPLDITVRQGGDVGVPAVAQREPGPAALALTAVAQTVAARMSVRAATAAARPLISIS
jgi:ATP-binding protein involved in chromosome partitioning